MTKAWLQVMSSLAGIWRSQKQTDRPRLVAGMATMPSRAEVFPTAFQSIIGQVDRLYLYLDGFDAIPELVRDNPKVVSILSRDEPDLGCDGKFLGVHREPEPCFYAGVDDDILYPPDFTERLSRELIDLRRRAVVGVHACRLHQEIGSYLNDRDVFDFRAAVRERVEVDAIGTGTLMFDTGFLKPNPRRWTQKNITDLQLAIEAAKNKVPMYRLATKAKFLRALDSRQDDSLYTELRNDDTPHTLLARELQAIRASNSQPAEPVGVRIFATNGILDKRTEHRFAHHRFEDRKTYCALLKSGQKFVSLRDAVEDKGPGLTIDGATVAAANAANLAREFGQEVTLFVNPWQIISGRPYWFSRLDNLLDQIDEREIEWNGRTYDVETYAGKEDFRFDIWIATRKHRSPKQSHILIDDIEKALGRDGHEVPEHLHSLTIEDLRNLQALGVDIQNHSWAYLDPAVSRPEKFAEEFHKAQSWLEETLGVTTTFLTIPYGEYLPHPDFLADSDVICLLQHDHISRGRFSEKLCNRYKLSCANVPSG